MNTKNKYSENTKKKQSDRCGFLLDPAAARSLGTTRYNVTDIYVSADNSNRSGIRFICMGYM
jgi:hypothetical protein